MSISDPAQILQRVPELHALSDDPRIRRAIATGDPFKLYRTLLLARLLRRLPQHAALLKLLTQDRRLFARSEAGLPIVRTQKIVGSGFIGRTNDDSDGSHVALRVFQLFWRLPLFPRGAYLVKPMGPHKWLVVAPVPTGIGGWLYARALALLALVLLALGVMAALRVANSQTLVVLNGFDFPLDVNFGYDKLRLPPQGMATLKLKVGQAHGKAVAPQGGLVDVFDETMVSSKRMSVWNIAGATPLLRNTVVYNKSLQSAPENQGSQTVYCGQRYFELSNIAYAFTDPPAALANTNGQARTSVEQVTIASRPGVSGVQWCIAYAIANGQDKEAAVAMEALAQLNGWPYADASSAVEIARLVSVAEAVRVAQRAAKGNPGDVGIARLLQDVRDEAGEHDALVAEHAERASLKPDAVDEQYLNLVLARGVAAIKPMQELVFRFPDNTIILRELAWRKGVHGDFKGALRDLARLRQLAPEEARATLGLEVRAMLASKKGPAALALLEAALRDAKPGERERLGAEYALVVRQSGGDPERHLKPAKGDSGQMVQRDLMRVRAGLAPLQPENASVPIVKLGMALRSAPGTALTIAASLSRAQFADLGPDQLALLYCEAVRGHQHEVYDRLDHQMHLSKASLAQLQAYVLGEAANIDELDLDLDLQAAAHFARSRNGQLANAERAALRARAAKADWMHGVISAALTQWQ